MEYHEAIIEYQEAVMEYQEARLEYHEASNIGTEIIYFQCFATTDIFLVSKSIIPEDFKSSRRVL